MYPVFIKLLCPMGWALLYRCAVKNYAAGEWSMVFSIWKHKDTLLCYQNISRVILEIK